MNKKCFCRPENVEPIFRLGCAGVFWYEDLGCSDRNQVVIKSTRSAHVVNFYLYIQFFQKKNDLYMSRSDFADIDVYAQLCACHDKDAQRYFGSINDAASICT